MMTKPGWISAVWAALTCAIVLSVPGAQSETSPPEPTAARGEALGASSKPVAKRSAKAAPEWRSRAEIIPFDNLEGILIVRARVTGSDGRDSAGSFVIDTGAGYLALDTELCRILGISDGEANSEAIGTADHPLPRFTIGSIQTDQISPILMFDAGIVRRIADREVLGLVGESLLRNYAVVIDYRREELALIPPSGDAKPATPEANEAPAERSARIAASRGFLGDAIDRRSVPFPYRRVGEGRIVLTARVSNPRPPNFSEPLRLILDTGATKSVLFESSLAARAPGQRRWPSLRGLSAPTLVGSADARLARVPRVELVAERHVTASQVDMAVLESELATALSHDADERIDGLLGYSFLRRFRVVIDYPRQVVWLEPVPHAYDDRPFEYSHVGIQVERRGGELQVAGIATGSPADLAGIERGDVIVSIGERPAASLDVLTASRLLEGPPRSEVRITLRRGSEERVLKLVRRRLL